jgi:DNA polymerase-3 subunit epsilon
VPEADLLAQPLASAEFLVVDTETNGLARERCELTEVGAVLVGGGELHDRWESLVGVHAPLSRGIQRFTGITQAMVDVAPPPEAVLPELARRLRGRVLVAHSARFDQQVLRGAFERAALSWPDPPVLCTVALARRFAPLQRRRGLAALAGALGVDVATVHRALPDAETCARVFCALFGRLCAHAGTIGEAVALLGPRRGGAGRGRSRGARRREPERPDLSALPKDPGVYVFRDADGRPLYVGKSVCVRTRARAHFTTPTAWTGQAAHVDYQATESELGALLLESRLIKALQPPGNVVGKRVTPDGYVYLRCRLDIAFPILEVARAPAAGHGVTVGPVRGRTAAAELVEQLNSLFGLRHCGRALRRRPWPSAYGQMGRCLSPCLGDLDPNLYRERLDAALRLFVSERDGSAALLAHIDAQMAAAAAERRYERAEWLRRRRARLEALLARLGGVLRATHAGARLVLAPHPAQARFDALWIAGGRVVDWGPLPEDPGQVEARTRRAVSAAPRGELGAWLPAGEIDEARLVGAWIAAHDPPALELDPPPAAGALREFVASAARELGQRGDERRRHRAQDRLVHVA